MDGDEQQPFELPPWQLAREAMSWLARTWWACALWNLPWVAGAVVTMPEELPVWYVVAVPAGAALLAWWSYRGLSRTSGVVRGRRRAMLTASWVLVPAIVLSSAASSAGG